MVKAGYGRIVNIASVAGKEGNPNASAYSTSKAAVIGLTKSLGKAASPGTKAGSPSAAALVAPRQLDDVFTARERRFCRRSSTLASWAGRYAAKLAVAELLGDDAPASLAGIEILPARDGTCTDPRRCAMGHPPAVHLETPASDAPIAVSISHDGGIAVAIACREERQ